MGVLGKSGDLVPEVPGDNIDWILSGTPGRGVTGYQSVPGKKV